MGKTPLKLPQNTPTFIKVAYGIIAEQRRNPKKVEVIGVEEKCSEKDCDTELDFECEFKAKKCMLCMEIYQERLDAEGEVSELMDDDACKFNTDILLGC